MRILVCGLPGAGKTTFAKKLVAQLGNEAVHLNGDELRKQFNDWDFSPEGRQRQAERMAAEAQKAEDAGRVAVCDFVCPTEEYRRIVDPNALIWANRTPVRNFADTTALFEKPIRALVEITDDTDIDAVIGDLVMQLRNKPFDVTAPTALMIGRYQPWHDGHRALFEKALEKHGQVCIVVRTLSKSKDNPFDYPTIKEKIDKSLQQYAGRYVVLPMPNIVDVVYGREVGWTMTKIDLPPEVEAISATKIRQSMGIANE